MKKEKLASLILITLLLLRLASLMPGPKELFKKNYNYERLEKAYYDSQYVLKDPKGIMPDNALYNFAAGFYLHGGNPILVNPEHPPLGKYLLALSILSFQNTKVVTYFFFYLTILAFFLLAKIILKNINLGLLITFVFTSEKLFLNQLQYTPMLNIFQLCFLLFAFYFFILWLEKKDQKYLFFASLSLAAAAAVMFFITAAVVFLSWLVFLGLKKEWRKIARLTLWVSCLIYLILTLSYTRTLLEEPNPLKVLSIQKWIFWFHQGKLTLVLTIWPLIFCNRWQTWWADRAIIQDPQWWLGLPILFTLSFLICFIYLKRKLKDQSLEVMMIWFLTYCVFISFGQANIRYLLPILPFLYLIIIKGLILIWNETVRFKT